MKQILSLFICTFLAIAINAQQNIVASSGMFHGNTLPDKSNNKPCQPIEGIKWKFKTGGKIFSSPAVMNGLVLVGSEDKNLYAIDLQTGKQKWKFATGGAVHSSPAVYGTNVYVGSFDGFYSININTGKQNWKFKTGGEKHIGDTSYWGMKPSGVYMNDLWDCFLSSPVVYKMDDVLTVYFGSSDGNLYAVDAANGSLLWAFKTNGIIHSSPTLYHGNIYIGSWDTYMYAINAKTGKEKWKFKTGNQTAMTGIQASATVQNGIVYFGARDAHFYALDANNGNIIWKYDAENSWIISSAIIKNETIYVGTSDTYLLLGLDVKTGKETFRFKANGYVFGSPAIAGNTVYVGDFTGNIFSIDINDPTKKIIPFSTEARKEYASTILKNDTLNFMYAAKNTDLNLYAANKKVMEDFYKLGPVVSSPVIKKNMLYAGSADGYLYALTLKVK
jgi:outer membrane protein assembly factor BamB